MGSSFLDSEPFFREPIQRSEAGKRLAEIYIYSLQIHSLGYGFGDGEAGAYLSNAGVIHSA